MCSFEKDLNQLVRMIREHVRIKIEPAVMPLQRFIPTRCHEILALLLDPRFCRGNTFRLLTESTEHARALFKDYSEQCLIPMCVRLRRFRLRELTEQKRGGQHQQNNLQPTARERHTEDELDDLLSDDEDMNDQDAEGADIDDFGISADVEK